MTTVATTKHTSGSPCRIVIRPSWHASPTHRSLLPASFSPGRRLQRRRCEEWRPKSPKTPCAQPSGKCTAGLRAGAPCLAAAAPRPGPACSSATRPRIWPPSRKGPTSGSGAGTPRPSGRVIGVDMTPAIVSKARSNAERVQAKNVEFRLGEIEHLPVADGSVDVILSNCVINLSPDKEAVFREALRVLRPGGRLAISDVPATAPLPQDIRGQLEAFTGCIAGAAGIEEHERVLRAAGFEDVRVTPRLESQAVIKDWLPGSGAEHYVSSATIEARRPGGARSCCGPSCCSPEAKS